MIYDAIAKWRSATAHREGRPHLHVLTHLEAAAITTGRPPTRAALLDLPGLGAGRVESYGEALIGIVGEVARIQDAAGG